MFTYVLTCYQLPRYFFFTSWELMTLWMAPVLLISYSNPQKKRRNLNIAFLILNIIFALILLILAILSSAFEELADKSTNIFTSISNFINYFACLILVTSYAIFLFRTMRKLNKISVSNTGTGEQQSQQDRFTKDIQWRAKRLFVSSVFIALFLFVRTFWNLFDMIGINEIKKWWYRMFNNDCYLNNEKSCHGYYIQYLLFYFFVDVVPPCILLMTFFIISRENKKSGAVDKEKEMNEQLYKTEVEQNAYVERQRENSMRVNTQPNALYEMHRRRTAQNLQENITEGDRERKDSKSSERRGTQGNNLQRPDSSRLRSMQSDQGGSNQQGIGVKTRPLPFGSQQQFHNKSTSGLQQSNDGLGTQNINRDNEEEQGNINEGNSGVSSSQSDGFGQQGRIRGQSSASNQGSNQVRPQVEDTGAEGIEGDLAMAAQYGFDV
ncbi:MAG: hypothetical protein EZS28_003337 [Streblomastix strix]|uniref:Uncharacterized protein n=1 Tax=Streblomastix strix TaxID=222440 RepID=A0A5J4X1N0_9EUKA|nr:MAG: hypothetical protein EZS28_003337 [Streblomastix strix]